MRRSAAILLLAAAAAAQDGRLAGLDESRYPKSVALAREVAKEGAAVVPELLALVEKRGDAVVEGVLTALHAIGPAALPAVQEAATSAESPVVRRCAVQALAYLPGGQPRVDALVAAAQDEATRREAFDALSWIALHEGVELGDGKSLLQDAVEGALAGDDDLLRRRAIFLFTMAPKELKRSDVYRLLRPLAKDPKRPLGLFALQAMESLRGHGPVTPAGRAWRAGRFKSRSAEAAIGRGLAFLAGLQQPDGRWVGPERPYDIGLTGLALLALLGAGEPDPEPLRRGVDFLLATQDEEGCFGRHAPHDFLYNHAIATYALAEHYVLGGDPAHRLPLRRAVRFIEAARSPDAVWGYEPRGKSCDTSITTWMMLALRTAWLAGLEVDEACFRHGLQWLDKMTDPEFGQVGYNSPGGTPSRLEGLQYEFPLEKTQSMTSAALRLRLLFGANTRDAFVRKGMDLTVECPPVWDPKLGSIDLYYWYFGSHAAELFGNSAFARRWRGSLHQALLDQQGTDGGWPAIGAWGSVGGEVYTAAMATMALQAPFRDGPLR